MGDAGESRRLGAFPGSVLDGQEQAYDMAFLAEVVAALAHDPFLPAGRLARRLYVSPSHLAHRFRALAGYPPGTLAMALRMQEAKRLLLATTAPVVHVALEVGYDSLGTFTTRFASLVGTSPGRFRARLDAPPPDPASGIVPVEDPGVTGMLTAPAGFTGLAFVGLFPSYLPARRPSAGIVARVPGPYRLRRCTPGWYRVMCAAFDESSTPRRLLLSDAAYVGIGVDPVRVSAHGAAVCDVALRPPAIADPPVVVSVGLLGGPPIERP